MRWAWPTTEEEEAAPGGLRRIVFDEGHHLFDAADSAFSGHLTALETAELRRWLRGPESERRRGRGLADRIGDLVADTRPPKSWCSRCCARPTPCRGRAGRAACRREQPEGVAEHVPFPGAAAGSGAGRTECAAIRLKRIALPLIDGLGGGCGRIGRCAASISSAPWASWPKRWRRSSTTRRASFRPMTGAASRPCHARLKKRGELMVGGWIDMLEAAARNKKPAVHRMVRNRADPWPRS